LTPPDGDTQVRIFAGSVVDNTTAFFMANPGAEGTGPDPTILIVNNPFLTYIAGNATFVTCTVQTCNRVGSYQPSLIGAQNAN
jgi:hypothetical protein